jgi:hypothetical protein
LLRVAVKTVNQATRAGSALLNQKKKRESFSSSAVQATPKKLIKLGHPAGELGEQGVSASHDTVFTGDTFRKKGKKGTGTDNPQYSPIVSLLKI